METSHQTILDLAAQRGLIRPRDLDALGLPSIALTRLVRQGLLTRVGSGLYAYDNAVRRRSQALRRNARSELL